MNNENFFDFVSLFSDREMYSFAVSVNLESFVRRSLLAKEEEGKSIDSVWSRVW